MTKDFKTQATANAAFGQYGLGWMAGGIAIGLIIGAAMYFVTANKQNPQSAHDVATATAAPPAIASTTPSTSTPEAANPTLSQQDAATEPPVAQEQPGFSYHAVLPQLEVDVPVAMPQQQLAAPQAKKTEQAAVNTPAAKPADAPPAAEEKAALQPIPTGFNGFQVGSYKTQDQAVTLQNRLKRAGLETRIEQADVKGETWFRVRLGPAASPEMMHKWQQTLSGMGISPLAVRM